MSPADVAAAADVSPSLSYANLTSWHGWETARAIDDSVRASLTRAFSDGRTFSVFPDRSALARLRAGANRDELAGTFQAMMGGLLRVAAEGNESDALRFASDARLQDRLTTGLELLHAAIARSDKPQLADRRFVFVRESAGGEALSSDGTEVPVLARVGKGPHWQEVPTIYLPLQLFDAVSTGDSAAAAALFDAFLTLLEIEERAIETGYAHIETPSEAERRAIDLLSEAVSTIGRMPKVEEAPRARRARVRPFTAHNRKILLEMLDARLSESELDFDFRTNRKAIDELERLAKRYKRVGDRDSLREVVRLLVAASGHDLHEIRDAANILLERTFAPKPFGAPLASDFQTTRTGTSIHFSFQLAGKGKSYALRIFRGKPRDGLLVEDDCEWVDVPLTFDRSSWLYVADYTFSESGQYDYLVYWRSGRSPQWVTQRRCSGRVSVIADIAGEIVLEIFPDVHGHTRAYWRSGEGHPGLVYNENGEVIRLGRFSDLTAHLRSIQARYRVTALYLLGVQTRGTNREDWAPESTSPSPFAPMSLTTIDERLGGEAEFRELVAAAHGLGIKIIVDVIPHLNRKATEIPDDFRVRCYDAGGNLVVRASTDGRFGSWNDGALLNYRRIEVWEWLARSVAKLITEYDIDGIRCDSWQSVPIMMKRDNYRFRLGEPRSAEEMVEGTIIDNDKESDHFITTGYYDSACREIIANPFQTYFVGVIESTLRSLGKEHFVYLAECYWGRERYLVRSGFIPYNSALFKICENIIHGSTTVREIYHLYEDYYREALPPGTELLGILGNHDERRALNTFGQRGLNAAVALTVFMSSIILDYEGNAEGEAWKVFLDNIYVNWNQFEYASHRSLEGFYKMMYDFHRANRGKGYLVRTNHDMVAAALKQGNDVLTLGIFDFSGDTQQVALRFDNPALPIEDECFYRVADPLYSGVTKHYNYFTGKELRVSQIQTVVSYTDRVKFLRLEVVPDRPLAYPDFLRDSFFRMCSISDDRHFSSSFAFREVKEHSMKYEGLASFLRERVVPLFDEAGFGSLELALKRAIYHLQRFGYKRGEELLDYIARLCDEEDPALRRLGESLRVHNERGPVLFISAEAEPFSKFGGLANVVYELPRELVRLGEKVCVITPLYRSGEERAVAKLRRAIERYRIAYTGRNVAFKMDGTSYEVGVHSGVVDGVTYYLLDHHEFFDGLYWGVTSTERLRRRVGFARACAEVIRSFDLRPSFTFTNDAYAGIFNGIVRLDSFYADSPAFKRNSFIHLIHNGGWQYFDSYNRYENGADLFGIFNLQGGHFAEFSDPSDNGKLNCMAAGIRCADRVVTVSPSYAEQLEIASDGLERLVRNVTGINNAIGSDFEVQLLRRFEDSGVVDTWYPKLLDRVGSDPDLREKLERRYPSILDGPRACERLRNLRQREIQTRMRNKLLVQVQEGLQVDPDRILFSMIHRIVEQKGFQLLLEASESVFRKLGFQGVIAGPISHGDQRAEEIARGLSQLAVYYRESVAVHLGFHDISIPLLSSDVFLMPSQYEPGGIAQLEAFAAGCLVVARATGGLRDTVFPIRRFGKDVEGNGFLFTDFNAEAFLDTMSRCAAFFRESSDERILAARQFARKSVCHWDASATRYIQEMYALKEIIRPEIDGEPRDGRAT